VRVRRPSRRQTRSVSASRAPAGRTDACIRTRHSRRCSPRHVARSRRAPGRAPSSTACSTLSAHVRGCSCCSEREPGRGFRTLARDRRKLPGLHQPRAARPLLCRMAGSSKNRPRCNQVSSRPRRRLRETASARGVYSPAAARPPASPASQRSRHVRLGAFARGSMGGVACGRTGLRKPKRIGKAGSRGLP
jgi:hypothetical protein